MGKPAFIALKRLAPAKAGKKSNLLYVNKL
jgi:hypothetical protein